MIHNPSWGPIAPPLPFPAHEPAIEYCITAGPGTLFAYGVRDEEVNFRSREQPIHDGELVIGYYDEILHIAPCTTACVTGA